MTILTDHGLIPTTLLDKIQLSFTSRSARNAIKVFFYHHKTGLPNLDQAQTAIVMEYSKRANEFWF